MRKRCSPLATRRVPSARATRCAAFTVDQWSSTSVTTWRRRPPTSRVPKIRSPARSSAMGLARPSAMRTGVSPARQ
ncbi:hypothetical protein [Nonomuraea dietziae]|uniref:Uncharacterized protein n=1 Tax=Nonomuraea dietziae TaxID=65515 RepID=A0A7W5VRB9_9ACTN|nr:hypothetical protein [Nonomuraea dietziae]MBB3733022.1 hypothetical protein [Nonomuraea dietziae]